MKWGLVPHWSKHEDAKLSTMNARREALTESAQGMWASIKGRKRCAVICEGYYEWLKKGAERLPHFMKHKDGRLMLLAGLYDCTVLEGQTEPLWTFTIVTTDASPEMDWLHDRQPVILSTTDELKKWLDTSSQQWSPELAKILEPYHDDKAPLVWYRVPKEVGKVGAESPAFIEPVSERKDGIEAMFARQKEGPKAAGSPGKKRKRSVSPVPGPSNTSETHVKSEVQPDAEKVNAWEDNMKIEYVDEKAKELEKTPEPSERKPVDKKAKPSPRKPSPRKQKASEAAAAGSQKITSFFAKT